MNTLSVEQANSEDVAEIVALMTAARDEQIALGKPRPWTTVRSERVEEDIANGRVYLFKFEGRTVGTVAVRSASRFIHASLHSLRKTSRQLTVTRQGQPRWRLPLSI